MANDRPKLQLSAPQVIGGALAAASAAVASSWLGVAGTVLGAVIVSLVASIGSALYTHSLERSSRKIRETLPVVPLRPTTVFTTGRMQDTVHDATTPLPALRDGQDDGVADAEPTTLTPRAPERRPMQWRTVAVSALASLAIAGAALTAFEAFAGKPVSAITGANDDGGTTMSQLIDHDPDASTPTEPGHRSTDPSSTTDQPSSGDATSPADSGPPQGSAVEDPGSPDDSSSTPVDGSDGSAAPTEPTPTEPSPTSPTEPAPTSPSPTSPSATP